MNKVKSPSGGPQTDAGKQISSQNSLAHGMCQQRFFLLPGESQDEYDALLETWRQQYDANDPAVPELVKTLAELDWMQQRCRGRICHLEMQLLEAEAQNDLKIIEFLDRRLLNACRYKTAAENSFQRALRALEKFRAIRKREEFTTYRLEVKEKQLAYDIGYKRAKLGLPEKKQDTTDEEPRPKDR